MRAQVGHQRVRVVGALDQHQAARGAQPGGERAHPAGEVGVRQAVAGAVAEQRGPVAVRREVVGERPGERGARGRGPEAAGREAGGTGHPQDFIRCPSGRRIFLVQYGDEAFRQFSVVSSP